MKELFTRIWTDPRVALAVLYPLVGAIGALLVAIATQGFSWSIVLGVLGQWVASIFATAKALYAESPIFPADEYPTEPRK